MGASQPYMYSPQRQEDSRFPESSFDPKAVTRQSWEPKPKKPQADGPLLSFNRHPDAHMVLRYRDKQYPSLGPRTKACIKWLRRIQLLLRLVQLNAALAILVLMILITRVETIAHWVLRVSPGVIALSCLYAIYHFSRGASSRTPASTVAYQLFAVASDLLVLGVYGFGTFIVYRDSTGWSTILDDDVYISIFVPTVYYIFISAGGLHVVSLCISLWLSWAFRQITLLPPDMNPLEDRLTARPLHKRNKSSVATFNTDGTEKRDSIISGPRRESIQQFEPLRQHNTVPFAHTRTQSRDSYASRDSRINLPNRQYQITPANSARNSTVSLESKRRSAHGSSHRGSYAEVPLDEHAPSPSHVDSPMDGQQRIAKFTETWKPTDSLISRTNQKNRELAAAKAGSQARASKSYSALTQRYHMDDLSDSENEGENSFAGRAFENDGYSGMLPDPLRANPAKTKRASVPRMKTPFYPLKSSLSEISNNERRVSASRDIADQLPALAPPEYFDPRDSFQVDYSYSRPYGELKPATPPVLVGNNRKVSSGNDYDLASSSKLHGRRNVSGKIVEEGRGGSRGSRFGFS